MKVWLLWPQAERKHISFAAMTIRHVTTKSTISVINMAITQRHRDPTVNGESFAGFDSSPSMTQHIGVTMRAFAAGYLDRLRRDLHLPFL